jgi:hypothetical protein
MSQNIPAPPTSLPNSNLLLNNSNSLSNPGLDNKVLANKDNQNFVMDVYNMLNADKENVGFKMEKNLARTSKLRSVLNIKCTSLSLIC